MRRKAKKDGNHDAIVRALEFMGCSVAQMHASGVTGFPDILVGCKSANYLVEIKDRSTAYGKKGLNPNQDDFAQKWRGGNIYVVDSVEQAIGLVKFWRLR